jgi:hypothetical protein
MVKFIKTITLAIVLQALFAAGVTAATITVPVGGDLQAAINKAQPGDEIVVSVGRFVGNFVLPAKPAGAPITIRTIATLDSRRMTAADRALMPILASPTVEPALTIVGTSNWRLDGISFDSTKDGMYNIIYIQNSSAIYLNRLVIIGGPLGQRRAVMGNGRDIKLTNSHIANIWRNGEESQAFAAWDGGGPFLIDNNYLEAASQSILFGGANSSSADNIPSDGVVTNNMMTKRAEWRGQPRVVKNNFEIKAGRRFNVHDNVMDGNWSDGQNGYAVLFTVRNDEGGSPWSVVEDVLFENNVIKDTEHCVNVLGYDSYQMSGRLTRVTVRNNTCQTSGSAFQFGGEVGVLEVYNNQITIPVSSDPTDPVQTLLMLYSGDVWPTAEKLTQKRVAQFAVESLVFANNVTSTPTRIVGDGVGYGDGAFVALTKSYSLVAPGPVVTPPPPPPTDPVVTSAQLQAAVADLESKLDVIRAELVAVRSSAATTLAKYDALVAYLAKTPTYSRVQDLVKYLRLAPK